MSFLPLTGHGWDTTVRVLVLGRLPSLNLRAQAYIIDVKDANIKYIITDIHRVIEIIHPYLQLKLSHYQNLLI